MVSDIFSLNEFSLHHRNVALIDFDALLNYRDGSVWLVLLKKQSFDVAFNVLDALASCFVFLVERVLEGLKLVVEVVQPVDDGIFLGILGI